jgi:hypothetical protein
MNKRRTLQSVRTGEPIIQRSSPAPKNAKGDLAGIEMRLPTHALFRTVWFAGNTLLILAILLAGYSGIWEYSTRKYLKGFSDAVVPSSASTEAKAEAILHWMSNGPLRENAIPDTSMPDRDPIDTLNYGSLLKICGSATNAFVNLADSAGLPARRLLLLDSRQMAMHVVAEVLVDGRWIVVDPAFRTVFRGSNGGLLTREQLTDPVVFSQATRDIRGYSPEYTFDHTVHVRVDRLGLMALPLRGALNRILPGWDDSVALSLLMERESLAMLVFAIVLAAVLTLLRIFLRWYGERWLRLRPVRVREQFRRACYAFLDTAG